MHSSGKRPRELRGSAEQFPTHESFQATSIVHGLRWLRFPDNSFRDEYGATAHRCSQSRPLDRRLFHSTGVFTRLFGRQNNEPGFRLELKLRQAPHASTSRLRYFLRFWC